MGEVVQGDTAVHSDWRRQGTATLLKLHTIAYTQQYGYAEITTSTASPGMLARAVSRGQNSARRHRRRRSGTPSAARLYAITGRNANETGEGLWNVAGQSLPYLVVLETVSNAGFPFQADSNRKRESASIVTKPPVALKKMPSFPGRKQRDMDTSP